MTNNSETYDIVIIGAGIQGAGVAQAAALCGGYGTSCKSSKLIHGGLRYLETGQLKLVRECLQERKLLLKNAPHLVKLIPFYIPVYANSTRPAWLIWLGLCIYSVLSLKKFSIVKKSQWKNLDSLREENLQHIFKYYDAQTDDLALTQAVIKSANRLGAKVLYNTKFIKSEIDNKTHKVSFRQQHGQSSVHCRCIINCSGPWIETTQKKISPILKIPDIDLISGTHIIIKHSPIQGAYYIQANDNRAIFIMPWKKNKILIGTTETLYSEKPDNVAPTDREVTYLLENYNQHFNAHATTDDITDTFAGLRVLPACEKSSFEKPRDSLIIYNSDTPTLITLVGGKLTSYRASAEKVIKHLKKVLPPSKETHSCESRDLKLE